VATFVFFFVITLEEGRVRPDDMTTMKLVLNSAQIGINYSIIVNKLHPKHKEKLLEGDNRQKLETCLNQNLPGTSSIYYNERVEELSGEDNMLHQLPTSLAQFIASSPVIEIKPEKVKDVKHENYDLLLETLSGKIEILLKDNDAMKKALIENTQKMLRIEEEHARHLTELYETHNKDMKKLIQSHQKELKRISEENEKKIALSNPPPPAIPSPTTPTPTPTTSSSSSTPRERYYTDDGIVKKRKKEKKKSGGFGDVIGTVGGVISNVLIPGSGPFIAETIRGWFD